MPNFSFNFTKSEKLQETPQEVKKTHSRCSGTRRLSALRLVTSRKDSWVLPTAGRPTPSRRTSGPSRRRPWSPPRTSPFLWRLPRPGGGPVSDCWMRSRRNPTSAGYAVSFAYFGVRNKKEWVLNRIHRISKDSCDSVLNNFSPFVLLTRIIYKWFLVLVQQIIQNIDLCLSFRF